MNKLLDAMTWLEGKIGSTATKVVCVVFITMAVAIMMPFVMLYAIVADEPPHKCHCGCDTL